MKLYHYAKSPYPVLRVSRLTVARTQKEVKELEENDRKKGCKFSYLDHLSFYFDPLPRNLGSLYEDAGIKHPVWVRGQVLYEHVIDTMGLEFGFDLVETPLDQQYMDRFWDDAFVEPGHEQAYYAYHRRNNELLDAHGYSVGMGYNTDLLEKAVAPFLGHTQDAYIQALQSQDKETLTELYAPAVPHVLVYPKGGKIIPLAVAKPFRLT